MRNARTLEALFGISLFIMILPAFLLSGCSSNNRLIPSGKTINIQQAKEFCSENPGDSVCSD